MFAGHVGVAMALGSVERRANVGALVTAALFLDFLLWFFILAGVESVQIPPDFVATHQPVFTFPYSHGLLAAMGWSVVAGAGMACGYRPLHAARFRCAWLFAAAVMSHWLLDALVHRAELPLAGASSPHAGLALWDSMGLALTVEASLLLAGLAVFLRGSSLPRGRSVALATFCVLMLALTIAGMTVAPPPPSAQAMAGSSFATLVLTCVLLGWLGRPPVQPPC